MHSHCYQPPPVPIQRPPSQRLIFCRRIRNGKSQTKRKEKSLYGSPGKRSSYYFFNYGVTESPPHYSFLIEKSFTLSYIASQTLSLIPSWNSHECFYQHLWEKRERSQHEQTHAFPPHFFSRSLHFQLLPRLFPKPYSDHIQRSP